MDDTALRVEVVQSQQDLVREGGRGGGRKGGTEGGRRGGREGWTDRGIEEGGREEGGRGEGGRGEGGRGEGGGRGVRESMSCTEGSTSLPTKLCEQLLKLTLRVSYRTPSHE